MKRVMLRVPADSLLIAQQRGARATAYEIAGTLLPSALRQQHRGTNSEEDWINAVAFLLTLGCSLDLISSSDAYGGSSVLRGHPRAANSNREGGKCSSKPRPSGTPRRRKPRLKVVPT